MTFPPAAQARGTGLVTQGTGQGTHAELRVMTAGNEVFLDMVRTARTPPMGPALDLAGRGLGEMPDLEGEAPRLL